MMKRFCYIFILLFFICTFAFSQMPKVQNRPYIDQRRFHYGFFIGLHTQDMEFVNNGFVTANGESWFMDVPEYLPGFQVGVLGEMFLHEHISLRLIPSLYFGDKKIVFKEQFKGERKYLHLRSTYVSMPVNVKFTSRRVNNYRPYIVTGASPIVNLALKKQKELLLNTFDLQVEIGVGCDIYLPFFKLIPEVKFSFGVLDVINRNRKDLTDKDMIKFTQSIDRASSRSISLVFYFE